MNNLIAESTLMKHHPQSWLTKLPEDDTSIYQFRNLQHFKNVVSQLSQKQDNNCGVTYKQAVKELNNGIGTIPDDEYQLIKHKVKESLLKRNLISENIYEGFHYTTEGQLIDIARYTEGNPECCIQPLTNSKAYFYELYINLSVNAHVSSNHIREQISKILATIQLLESEKIYIKLNVIDATEAANTGVGKPNYICIVPIFSHRDHKSINQLSSVVNERFLRKFLFALEEYWYGDDLANGYGKAINVPHCINIGDDFDAVQTAEHIIDQLVVPCKKRVRK